MGGGILSDHSILNVTNCTIVGNRAFEEGGGIASRNGSILNVTNSTLTNNSADYRGGGIWSQAGGIFNPDGTLTRTLYVTNSTISGNTAGDGGGGIYESLGNDWAVAYVTSSIVAGNTAPFGPDVWDETRRALTSQGFNLIGVTDGSVGFTAATDQAGTSASPLDPKLDPAGLQVNGGPTPTIALQPGSPAIDKGTSNSLATDQRGAGFLRAFDDPLVANATGGDGTDIGALEAQPGTGDSNRNGIPDNADPDTLAAVVIALPVVDFRNSGSKSAFQRKLGDIKQLILAGDSNQAVEEWRDLRQHADGCGAAATADKNDWITSCASQPPVRAFIDFLAANLSR